MRFFVTGTAGFIGFHLARRLLADGHDVTGLDGMTSYYDVTLKKKRHQLLREFSSFQAHEFMIEDAPALKALLRSAAPDVVIHMAAQAGVRYSIDHPDAYVSSNFVGTFNLLEACRTHPVRHLLLASTSSIYGANTSMPFRELDRAAHPLTLYAATKRSTELVAHCYSHLWGIPTTALRFFTVYGPWGRPDMAIFKFVKSILRDEPIDVYNFGKSSRDFTYIDDLIESIVRLIDRAPQIAAGRVAGSGLSQDMDSISPVASFRCVNVGGGHPVNLDEFISEIERALGKQATRNYLPLPQGDVEATIASPDLLLELTGCRPSTPISVGVPAFVDWYRSFYGRS